MSNLNANHERILAVLRKRSRDQPKLSDLELVSLCLTAEFMGIDSENDLFRKFSKCISSKIERSVYNRRRRKLANGLNHIHLKLASQFNEFEDYFVVDSIPSEVCKLSRSSRSKIFKEDTYTFLGKGYCAAQSVNYYGYKLHAVCSIEGVFQSIDLSPASVHDSTILKTLRYE